jgi:hypothetical protein
MLMIGMVAANFGPAGCADNGCRTLSEKSSAKRAQAFSYRSEPFPPHARRTMAKPPVKPASL